MARYSTSLDRLEAGLYPSNKLWLISDTHFGHNNIIIYAQREKNHEVIMLSNWIDRVGEDDQVLHLGDFALGGPGNQKRWAKLMGRLPGKKFLIKGNHDPNTDEVFDLAGFTLIKPFIWKEVAFTHEPLTAYCDHEGWWSHPDKWRINVHGHTHGNDIGKFEGDSLDGQRYVNVCVEKTKMCPMQYGNVLNLL